MKIERYKLESMPYAQCHVKITDDALGGEYLIVDLISYSTTVIRFAYNKTLDLLTIQCTGTYSPTTSRHINRFTREFCGDNMYYYCKGLDPETEYNADTFKSTFLNRVLWYRAHGKRHTKY